ncbi:PKD domain-containing protein [Phaeodactylibacter xiamenensis]|uniref:PKD domain-containing protein n=1 Tax=Phaeodactylibacter xiamenensis TaxID=1524460 RepID=UPI003CCC11F8
MVWAFTLPFVSSEIYAQEIPYCGWYEKHGSGIFNFEGNSDGFYDRFGNHYSTWELQVPSTGLWQGLLPQSNHCDCQTEFNLNISPFALRFEDLLNGGTGVGFDDGANGVIARRTMCEVFVELSGLIEPTSNPCGEEDPVVRIKIGRSDEDLSEGGGALGLSSPFIYSRYFEGEMADGMPWLLINGGNDATSAIGSGLFHGQIWINFFGNAPGFDGWNFSHQSLPNGNKHDLFTVCRHEALHVLGFASFINTLNPVTGAPVFNNYHRYDTHLELTTGNSLIQNGPYDLDFNQNISSAAFDQDCQAAGASVQFVTANNSLDIFTVPSSNINRASMFSHFCGGGATNLLMSPTLEANERRSINSSYEEAVLRALGYKINIGDCNVAGVDDIGPACTNNVFSGDLCLSDNDPSNDQVDITFSVEDLIGNDGEGVDGIAFLELNVGSGQLTNNGDGTYTFSSALPGISVLRYIPTSSSCNKAGNVTRVTISIDVCEGECAFVENGGLTTIDDGFNRNPCNLICNPEFSYMFNNPNTNNDEKLPIGCGGLPGAQAPGVEKATESPDVYFNSFIPYVDLVNGARKHVAYMQIDFDNGEVVVEESIHIPVTIEPESNYLISGFHSCFGNTAEMEMHFASINDLISDQFCPFEKTLVSDVEAYPSGYKEVFKSDYENIANNPNDINWTKFATCFEFNGEFEGTSLWIYPQFVPGSSTTQEGGVISFLDQLELIEDNFDAGQPISISCNQTITIGGDEFCMLSDMAVEYSWYEASDVTFSNPLLSYTLEREYDGTLLIDGQPGSTIPTVQVSPTVNTSYILRRIYIPDPNTEYPTPDFVFCKDTDDLHVEVIGSYDPGFVIYACDYDIIATAVETDQSLDYNWTISDGTTLTGQSISHTVSGDGSYSITLSVGIEGVCQSTSFFPSITLPANCTSFCCPVGATSISDTYVSFGGLSSNIDYCLSGTLIVDDDFVYSGSMSIEPNAKIIVKSGNTLELTGAKLDGCTALWEGISVEGGARLIMSNSEIRDAKTAIFAMRHSYLDITKSNFLQNHIGIQLQPRVEVAPFFDNLFDGSTPLLPALGNDPEIGQSAYSGIISETEKLFIGVEGEGVNEFSFLRNGILSSSQILSVVNSNFSDIRFDSSEPYSIMGYGIFDRHNLYCGSNTSNVTFDDCDFGIYSYGSPGDEIRVTNNTMSNVSTGVSVNKFRYGNIYLIQNEIRATHTGIALLDNNQLNQLAVNSNLIHLTSTGIFGIEVEELGIGQQNAKIIGNEVNLSGISNGIFIRGAQGYELWNNHVKFINGDPGLGIALRAAHHTLLNDNLVEGTSSNTDAIGIDVYSSASVMFDCNTIRNMGVGVSFKGACAGIFVEFPQKTRQVA